MWADAVPAVIARNDGKDANANVYDDRIIVSLQSAGSAKKKIAGADPGIVRRGGRHPAYICTGDHGRADALRYVRRRRSRSPCGFDPGENRHGRRIVICGNRGLSRRCAKFSFAFFVCDNSIRLRNLFADRQEKGEKLRDGVRAVCVDCVPVHAVGRGGDLVKKGRQEAMALKASYTVEASLLIPMVLAVMLLLFMAGKYLYQETAASSEQMVATENEGLQPTEVLWLWKIKEDTEK